MYMDYVLFGLAGILVFILLDVVRPFVGGGNSIILGDIDTWKRRSSTQRISLDDGRWFEVDDADYFIHMEYGNGDTLYRTKKGIWILYVSHFDSKTTKHIKKIEEISEEAAKIWLKKNGYMLSEIKGLGADKPELRIK